MFISLCQTGAISFHVCEPTFQNSQGFIWAEPEDFIAWFRSLLERLWEDVEGGGTLTETLIYMLARYPQPFHPPQKSIECFSLIFPQGLLFVKCVSSWVKHILKLLKHDITCIPEFTGPSVEPKFIGVTKDFIQMSGVIGVSSTTLGEPPTLCELWLHQLYKYSENCVFWQSVSVTINQEWIAWDKYMWVSCLIHQVTFTTARLVLLWKVMVWENPGLSFPTSPLMVSNRCSRDGIYHSRDQESWVKVSVKNKIK